MILKINELLAFIVFSSFIVFAGEFILPFIKLLIRRVDVIIMKLRAIADRLQSSLYVLPHWRERRSARGVRKLEKVSYFVSLPPLHISSFIFSGDKNFCKMT